METKRSKRLPRPTNSRSTPKRKGEDTLSKSIRQALVEELVFNTGFSYAGVRFESDKRIRLTI